MNRSTANRSTANRSTAIVLVGHGTRDEAGQAEFFALAALLKPRVAPALVHPCFLELADPTIEAAVADAVASGADEIVVVPLLLFAAGHAKQDIPAAVAAAIRRATGQDNHEVTWRQTGVLGCHAKLLELSALRYNEALSAAAANVAADDTSLIFVGRGSRDIDATAEMHRFAALRRQATPVGRCEVAFVAMAEPKYPAVLRAAAEGDPRRIVVQPHLLFAGEILERLRADIAALRAECTSTDWAVTGHLGPHALLADAVVDLIERA